MHAEAIYKGATRPAMLFGVPLVPLVVLVGLAVLSIMWLGPMVSWWVAPVVLLATLPLLIWMRQVTRHDDQRLRQMFVSAKLRWHDRNHRFWQSRSYAPYLYRGTRHAWHR
jgi:type IV secretion system protein VirB3